MWMKTKCHPPFHTFDVVMMVCISYGYVGHYTNIRRSNGNCKWALTNVYIFVILVFGWCEWISIYLYTWNVSKWSNGQCIWNSQMHAVCCQNCWISGASFTSTIQLPKHITHNTFQKAKIQTMRNNIRSIYVLHVCVCVMNLCFSFLLTLNGIVCIYWWYIECWMRRKSVDHLNNEMPWTGVSRFD